MGERLTLEERMELLEKVMENIHPETITPLFVVVGKLVDTEEIVYHHFNLN